VEVSDTPSGTRWSLHADLSAPVVAHATTGADNSVEELE
jgi:hypothetical protein